MSFKSNIKKILFLSLAAVLSAGLLVLLVAAINKKNHKTCTGVEITIHGAGKEFFLNRQDVMNMLVPDRNYQLLGKPLVSFNLKKMEAVLEQNVWVREGQMFFDNNGVLRITVEERAPVARIFTVDGISFYIDSSGKVLPLNSKVTVKLPVYTNFPADKQNLYGADSLLMQHIKQMSRFMLADSFWMAQIGQIDITPAKTFEMMPVIGKHIIVFGSGADYVQKFHRLFLFYRQVSTLVGLDKYSIINVAYEKQVVATRKGSTGKVDSIQAVKNIQKLIQSSQQLLNDTVSTMVDNNIVVNAAPASTLTILKYNKKHAAAKDSFTIISHPVHTDIVRTWTTQRTQKNKQAKAIMRKPGG